MYRCSNLRYDVNAGPRNIVSYSRRVGARADNAYPGDSPYTIMGRVRCVTPSGPDFYVSGIP